MESFDDRELSGMLREWKAPAAPPTLRARVVPARQPWWRWLLTGTIRVPVPVGVAAAIILAVWIYSLAPDPPVMAPQVAPVSLADFQPVARFEPKIVGEP